MLVPLLGHTVIAYGVLLCFGATLVLAVWGLIRRSPWLLMTSSLSCMFVSVALAPSLGLAGLPLPLLLFMLGLWRLVPGRMVARVLLTLAAGLVYVVLAFELVALLIA